MKAPGVFVALVVVTAAVLAAYLNGVGGLRKTWESRSELHDVPSTPASAVSSVAEEPIGLGMEEVKLRRPMVVSGGEEDQDSTSIDEQVGLRAFKVKLKSVAPGEDAEKMVSAAYVEQLPVDDMPWRITYVADQGAGFGDEFHQELPSGREDLRMWLYVGNFAQDNCGDFTTLFAAQTPTVFMVSFADQTLTDQLLKGAGCDKASKDAPPAADHCEKRSACVAKHLTGKLDPQLANHPAARALRQLVLQ